MKARDVLLFGLLAPVAAGLRCGTMLTEGFCETRPDEPFSAQPDTVSLIEETVRAFGFDVAIRGLECPGMQKYADLFRTRPERVPLLMSCEAIAPLRAPRRRAWRRDFPSLRLYASQCGSRTKCLVLMLARLLGDAGRPWNRADVRRAVDRSVGAYRPRASTGRGDDSRGDGGGARPQLSRRSARSRRRRARRPVRISP